MKYSICYAPDNNYTDLALISMISVIENNKELDLEFIILYSQLLEENILKFKKVEDSYNNCKIRFIQISENEFEDFPIAHWVSIQTWFRTKIADLCPDIDKILYLDCDTLVVKPIKDLLDTDITNYLIAGVCDIWGVNNHVKRLELKDEKYFNAGIILINCRKWREDGIFEKLKDYTINNAEKLECSDQCALNKVSDGAKLLLHQKYNYMQTWWVNCYDEYKGEDKKNFEEAKNNPTIIHFTGLKPNHYNNANSYKKLWWEYARKSPLYDELLSTYLSEKEAPDEQPSFINLFLKAIYYILEWKLTPFSQKELRKKRKQKTKKLKTAIKTKIKLIKINKDLEQEFLRK